MTPATLAALEALVEALEAGPLWQYPGHAREVGNENHA